ncbi:MAG: hydroxyacid dehydrogenase [Alphaproteobacteria bacterium BRH_c36]|nr:MAG: hydroxyacid dehydrogenase [Alphaproteobacteria bacterium BRH_c36]
MTKLNHPTAALIDTLSAIVGERYAVRDPQAQAPYLSEWRDKYFGKTSLVLRPGTAREVSQIIKSANDARVGIVPQGGNTGLVGGQIPFESGHEIVVSLERLNRVRHVDAAGGSMVVEAGVTLSDVQKAADEAGALFPLSLGSEGSCRIGGNLASNAGGVQVLAYGNARDLTLGLEVVLADGRIWDGLRALKKDNTGYDLKQLFVGSEGTLGIITAAVLKLFAKPAEHATALVAVGDLDATLALFERAREVAGTSLTAFEFLSGWGLDTVAANMPGARKPLDASSPWYVLMEISSGVADGAAQSAMERIFSAALEKGWANDAVLAASLDQSQQLWKLREDLSEAQKYVGGSIKHDISVPVARIPEFVRRAADVVEGVCPGARPFIFGHFGDGNVHYNVAQPEAMDKAAYLSNWDVMNDAVHALVASMDGSISAEHGIGRMKREALTRFRSKTELDMMRAIKAAFDPNGILNPGKVL